MVRRSDVGFLIFLSNLPSLCSSWICDFTQIVSSTSFYFICSENNIFCFETACFCLGPLNVIALADIIIRILSVVLCLYEGGLSFFGSSGYCHRNSSPFRMLLYCIFSFVVNQSSNPFVHSFWTSIQLFRLFICSAIFLNNLAPNERIFKESITQQHF